MNKSAAGGALIHPAAPADIPGIVPLDPIPTSPDRRFAYVKRVVEAGQCFVAKTGQGGRDRLWRTALYLFRPRLRVDALCRQGPPPSRGKKPAHAASGRPLHHAQDFHIDESVELADAWPAVQIGLSPQRNRRESRRGGPGAGLREVPEPRDDLTDTGVTSSLRESDTAHNWRRGRRLASIVSTALPTRLRFPAIPLL